MKKKLIFLFLIVSFVEADYTVKVVVKFPFAPSYLDSLGNIVRDSLIRDMEIKMRLFKKSFYPIFFHKNPEEKQTSPLSPP